MKENIVHIGKGTDILREVPKAPAYLSNEAKKHYLSMGLILAKNDLLKERYLSVLEIYAEGMAQWQFSLSEIKRLNKEKYGSGYIQKFKSGATNVSVYVTLKDKAEESIMKFSKVFGLDPKSEKELKIDSPQLDLFKEILKEKNSVY